MAHRVFLVCGVALMVAIAACTPAAPRRGSPPPSAPQSQKVGAPKRVTIAIRGEPRTFSNKIDSSPSVPGGGEVEQLLNAGLAVEGPAGELRAQLAEDVPSVENGLWRLFADGRMETTWRVRANARWHDGTSFTTEDLVFTARAVMDRDLPEFRDAAFDSIDALEQLDARSLTVAWKRPFIGAHTMFTQALAMPMAKHVLEEALLADKAAFSQHPGWGESFVGTGPFKLREWARGSHLRLDAFDDYALGRPRLDQVEVRFIEDANTFFANMLAGTVDVNLGGRNLSLEQALQLRDQWDGRMELKYSSRFVAQPQLLNPTPAVVGDVRFRRALIQAIDRQQLADALLPGANAPVAHVFLNPNEPEFREVERALVRYEFDQRRATGAIEALGMVRGQEGAFRDPSSQRVTVEMRTVATDLNQRIMLSIADSWQRVGVGTETVVVPPQRQRDLAYRATFPAFDTQRQPSGILTLNNLYSSEARLPETNYLGRNYSRYMNPALDALIDRYFNTVPWADRMEVGRQIMQHVTDQVIWLDLFYDAQPILVGNRLRNVAASKSEGGRETWNAHEWEVAS